MQRLRDSKLPNTGKRLPPGHHAGLPRPRLTLGGGLLVAFSMALICASPIARHLPFGLSDMIMGADSVALDVALLFGFPFVGSTILMVYLGTFTEYWGWGIFGPVVVWFAAPIIAATQFEPWYALNDQKSSAARTVISSAYTPETLQVYEQIAATRPIGWDSYLGGRSPPVDLPTAPVLIRYYDGQKEAVFPVVGSAFSAHVNGRDWAPYAVAGDYLETIDTIWQNGETRQDFSDRPPLDLHLVLLAVEGFEASDSYAVSSNYHITPYLRFADLYLVDLRNEVRVQLPARVHGREPPHEFTLKQVVVVGGGTAHHTRMGPPPDNSGILEKAAELLSWPRQRMQ